MGFKTIEWAMKQPGTPTQKHVLLVLANHANDGNEAFPSTVTLCEATGLSNRAVRQAKYDLIKAGFITRSNKFSRCGVRLNVAPDASYVAPPATSNVAPDASYVAPPARKKASPATHHNCHLTTKQQAVCEDAEDPIGTLYDRLAPLAFEAAGFDPARDVCGWGIVRQWVADAFNAGLNAGQAERVILQTLKANAGPARKRVGSIYSLKFFSQSVQRAISSGKVPDAPLTPQQRKARVMAKIRWEEADRERRAAFQKNPDAPLPPTPKFAEFLAEAEREMAQGAAA